MTDQETILAALKGRSAQSPMTVGELATKSGLPASELELILDRLYDIRAINRCTLTYSGCTTKVVWPTGVVEKIAFGTFAINPRKPVAAEFKPAAKADKSTPQKQEQIIMKPEKSRARIMLEIIAEKGVATLKELTEAAGTTSVTPFIKGPVGRGEIIVEGEHGAKLCRLAPGVTAENLLSGGRKKIIMPVPLAQTPETTLAPISAPAPVFGVLARRYPLNPIPQPKLVPESISDTAEVVDSLSRADQEVPAKTRFRVAFTSDKTILLFGLSQEPIELDCEQAQILAGFISERDILCA